MNDDYRAAIDQIVFYPLPNHGLLRISGKDRVDFLQRQSTNDIHLLSSQQSITTVLTNPEARILDVLVLIEVGDEIWGLSLPGKTSSTFEFLKKKIFFNDDVALDDISRSWFQIEIDGGMAGQLMKTIGCKTLAKLGETASIKFQSTDLRVFSRPGLTTTHGYTLLGPAEHKQKIIQSLKAQGAVELTSPTREILRIEAGIGGSSTELTTDYTPLEVLLEWAISTHKGCYTGQEIIARQINYDKITKRLSKLHTSSKVSPGMNVKAENKIVGVITSAALSPRLGPIALAVLRRPYFEPGTQLLVNSSQEIVEATVQ